MAISLSRKKLKPPKKAEPKECCSSSNTLLRFFYKVPIAISLLLLIYLWSSSSTIISGKIVHVCVSSRRLNSLYCISAGTQPNFEIPIPLVENGTEANVELKTEIPTPTLESSTFDGYSTPEIPNTSTDNSTTFSPTVNLESEKEIQTPISSPMVDNNSTIGSPIVNEDFLELSFPSFDNSSVAIELFRDDSDPTAGDNGVSSGGGNGVIGPTKEVELRVKELRAFAADKTRKGCEGRGIYVYDLPSKFNKNLVGECNGMVPWMNFCKYFTNEGLGEPIPKLGKAWYQTHMYSLEPIFHSRVMKHPCRVYTESEAKLFYVPFYGGLDILRWHFRNVSNDVKDALALDLIKWLEKQWSWRRNSGKDHVFVLGKISWDFRRKDNISWGTRFLELEQMRNPAKILIEREPWDPNDIGVPHPTYFHPNSDDDITSWQEKIISSNRRNLVSFAGAARPNAPDNIRSILISQCSSSEDQKCKFLDCNSGGCKLPESVIELFVGSEFCLQPPGDSPTRKSVFDSLVSGCIPVIFDPFTAYYQYPWHLPEDHSKYSVFIDQKEVREKEVNVVERLTKISKKERDDMRRYIVYELLPGLVYGGTDSRLDMFRDAFAITIDSLLERLKSL